MKDAKKRLLEQLDALKIFSKNKLVRELEQQLRSKLEKLEKKEKPNPKEAKKPNLSRSSKLRRHHRYIRLIMDNTDGKIPYSEIRKQLSRRKQGLDVSIPDPIWKNPSP